MHSGTVANPLSPAPLSACLRTGNGGALWQGIAKSLPHQCFIVYYMLSPRIIKVKHSGIFFRILFPAFSGDFKEKSRKIPNLLNAVIVI
jgi:hypothetical protein